METKFYRVGGCVRDSLMGVKSKDIDFSVESDSYESMKNAIIMRGCEIKVEKPEFFTIRAIDRVLGGVDFVLCRKEGDYSDGRRPDSVQNGTLFDDLSRRDFTMNAIAQDDAGNIIDPFGGKSDIDQKLIKCVGNASDRFSEDSLRMLRAIRFAVTKGFDLSIDIHKILHDPHFVGLVGNVSQERIREELFKMFKHDTLKSLLIFEMYPLLKEEIFSKDIWLMPTSAKN